MRYGILGKIQRLHIVGIGGAGMSAIAKMLYSNKITVTGSDIQENEIIQQLREIGIMVSIGHRAENIGDAEVVAHSSAIKVSENPEISDAIRKGIPVIKRDELLGELMRLKMGICIAGTHGKSTVTTMIGTVLMENNIDPTILMGGHSEYFKGGAVMGNNKLMIVEADEYDKAFLKLSPTVSVVTNIEIEHVDIYKDGIEELRKAFKNFVNKTPFFGKVIGCKDNQEVKRLLSSISKSTMTYSIDDMSADVKAVEIKSLDLETSFSIIVGDKRFPNLIKLHAVGKHNVYNALAAICVGLELGLEFEAIANGLEKFRPVSRRFQIRSKNDTVIIDDYAHHPTEIKATLKTAREVFKGKKIIAVLQPHLYSRVKMFYKEFAEALKLSDIAAICEIYAARESAQDFVGVKSSLIANQLSHAIEVKKDSLLEWLLVEQQKDSQSVFVFMGAGDITKKSIEFSHKIKQNVFS